MHYLLVEQGSCCGYDVISLFNDRELAENRLSQHISSEKARVIHCYRNIPGFDIDGYARAHLKFTILEIELEEA